eukprot:gb/GECG01004912.1/.p1 GENE.gb/GECG01004912.1/~~gb/GECG01004912.1/.p1  ORF type:complete len:197 (+),score=7.24 gb/GECG01004912.1/:1-591(+)
MAHYTRAVQQHIQATTQRESAIDAHPAENPHRKVARPRPKLDEFDRNAREEFRTHPVPLGGNVTAPSLRRYVDVQPKTLLRRMRKHSCRSRTTDKRCAAEVVDSDYLRPLEQAARLRNRESLCRSCYQCSRLIYINETVGYSGEPQFALVDCPHSETAFTLPELSRIRQVTNVSFRAEAALGLPLSGVDFRLLLTQ